MQTIHSLNGRCLQTITSRKKKTAPFEMCWYVEMIIFLFQLCQMIQTTVKGRVSYVIVLMTLVSVFVWAEETEGSRGREQTEAGLYPHLVSNTVLTLFNIQMSASLLQDDNILIKFKDLTQCLSSSSYPTVTNPTPTRSRWPTARWQQWTERAPGPSMQQAEAEPARAAIVSFVHMCVFVCVTLKHKGSEHGSFRNKKGNK